MISLDACLETLNFPSLVKFASQTEFTIQAFIHNHFPTLEPLNPETLAFTKYLNRIQFWQVVRAVKLITDEDKFQETVQSINFYFDLMAHVFQTIEAKFGAPIGHLLVSFFDQDIVAKLNNIPNDNKTLRSIFGKKYVEFLDKALVQLSKEQKEEVMRTIFKYIKIE